MTLHIHHAAHLPPLATSLAAVLQHPLPDPFTAEVVAVPTVGVRDWLLQQLALRLGAGSHDDGIAANVEMVFLNRFTAAALGRPLGASSPWDIDRLTWTVLHVLHRGTVDVPGWHAHRHTDPTGPGAYTTARRIADLFDRYANNRPQMLRQWAAGRFGDGTEDDHGAVVPLASDQLWQAQLWSAARAHIGEPTMAEQLPDLLAGIRDGRIEPALPDRVAVFGVSGVSVGQLSVLRVLGAVRDVHLHLVHPSPAAWRSVERRLGGRLVLRSAVDATAGVRNPLLRSWGRPPMETAMLVQGIDDAVVEAADGREPGGSLLGALQRDIVDDRVTAPGHPAPTPDRSVQVHACHGTTRQLEVLRDALGHLFTSDSTLAPHDVVVLCPDLGRFAPLIQSVFQRSSLPVPVRVSDPSLGSTQPVATALLDLLATIAGRCTGPDVLQLIAHDPVQRMFGLDEDDAERIGDWVGRLGTSWGLDDAHRGEWIPAHIVEGTWSATLDRLLLGAAMPATAPRIGPGGIVPFDDVDADGLRVAGKLAEIITRLRRARLVCGAPRTVDAWVDVVCGLVTEFLTTRPDDAWQVAEVVEAVTAVSVAAADNDVPLSFADARTIVNGALADDRGRLALRTGAVTATALLPVRNLPSRVVCILGLDEVAMRTSGLDGDDILAVRPCVGERDQRVEGRHLLLDALMAASEHFIVTFDGTDITTNRAVPQPVVLNELLDAIDTVSATAAVVRVHPRQAFAEPNFLAGDVGGAAPDERPFSFDDAMLDAALARRSPAPASVPWPLLDPLLPATVDLASLTSSCVRPERTWLQGRLDARLPREVDDADPSIPIRFTGLDQYQLGSELLDLHRRGADDGALEAWRAAHRLSGALPPRSLADAVLDEARAEVDRLLEGPPPMHDLVRLATDHCPVHLDVVADGSGGDVVAIRDTVRRIHGHTIVRVDFLRPGPRALLGAALELAALVLTDPDRPWEARVVCRPKTSTGKTATVDCLRPRQGPERAATAHALLSTALSVHLRALREPLPMFERSSQTLFEKRTIDDDEYGRDIRSDAAQFVWGAHTADDILAIELRTDDELPAIATATTGRAQALADLLWNAFHAFVEPTTTGEAASDRLDTAEVTP